jgi:hypothetical protein
VPVGNPRSGNGDAQVVYLHPDCIDRAKIVMVGVVKGRSEPTALRWQQSADDCRFRRNCWLVLGPPRQAGQKIGE